MTVFQMFVLAATAIVTASLLLAKSAADRQRESLVPIRVRRGRR